MLWKEKGWDLVTFVILRADIETWILLLPLDGLVGKGCIGHDNMDGQVKYYMSSDSSPCLTFYGVEHNCFFFSKHIVVCVCVFAHDHELIVIAKATSMEYKQLNTLQICMFPFLLQSWMLGATFRLDLYIYTYMNTEMHKKSCKYVVYFLKLSPNILL